MRIFNSISSLARSEFGRHALVRLCHRLHLADWSVAVARLPRRHPQPGWHLPAWRLPTDCFVAYACFLTSTAAAIEAVTWG